MTKPNIIMPVVAESTRGKRVSVSTNVVPVVSGVLYYELMVAWHATMDEKTMKMYNDKIFKEVDKNFGKYMDGRASAMPTKYHHVYEWNQVGKRNGRLWKMRKRQTSKTNMAIRYDFLTSKRPAPINPILLQPGPSGKVVKRTSIFKNKAFVMEEGLPVTMRPKNGRWLAIPRNSNFTSGRNILFSQGPVTVRNPGGVATKFAFSRTFSGYFSSGLATKDLNRGRVLQTPARITKKAGENIPSAISGVRTSRGLDKNFIDSIAQSRVEMYAQGEYR
jgi:hypothetical protein